MSGAARGTAPGGTGKPRGDVVPPDVAEVPKRRGPGLDGVLLDDGSPYASSKRYRSGRLKTYWAISPGNNPSRAIASKDGKVQLHRAVLFDAIGEGPHRCRWCLWDGLDWHAERLTAEYLVVDHLNGNGSDNRLANLAPAHAWCNNNRFAIERDGIDWATYADVPPSQRKPLRDTANNGSSRPAVEGDEPPLAPLPAEPTNRRQLPPIRKGLVRWEDLVR